MKIKPKQYEDEPEPAQLPIGCFSSFAVVPANDVRKKPQIGFIRQKPKRKKRTRTRTS